MGFLTWYYQDGIKFYLKRWYYSLAWVNHYFSLPLLAITLFSPWHRLVSKEVIVGFNPAKIIEQMTFNLISRGVGFVVRITLLFTGLTLLLLLFVAGSVGFFIWLAVPFLGIPIYMRYNERLEYFVEDLFSKVKTDPKSAIKTLFDNEAGKFVVDHTGLTLADLSKETSFPQNLLQNFSPKSYKGMIQKFVEAKTWPDDFFRKHGLFASDLILAANWWDERKREKVAMNDDKMILGRPGIGLELVFGYTPALNQYSVDLGGPQSFSHHLIGRQDVVSRMERVLTAGTSIVLVGQPGVGKRTVVLEFAHRGAQGLLGSQMAYRRVLEFDYNFLLAGTLDLNTKKTKLAEILSEAANAGNIILVVRDIHRLTNSDVEGYDFTDVFEGYLERRDLKIIAISSSVEYERFLAQNFRLRKYLETIEVIAPTREEAMEILFTAADDWERKKYITITVPTLRRVLEGSDQYITETPFPEKALELLDKVVIFREQNGGGILTVDDVNRVLEEKTGISFAHLTQKEKEKLGRIEEIIHKRLINQETAVSLIAKSLRGRSVGVKEENRPIGSFLFLGPTGVGKTETAKVLAQVYYGSEKNILRFDMAEFAGSEGLGRLIGSLTRNQPGALTTAIKNKPASLLLLDELEKAPPEVFNLLLTLLDEGYMTDAFGRKINCKNLFVIATSNAAAEYIRQLVSKGTSGENLQKLVVDQIQRQGLFSPEFLNRFDGVVVFEPLKKEYLLEIARLQLNELAENLKNKGIYLEVTDEAAKKLSEDGYEPEFGARPMRRIIDLILGDLLGKAILSGQLQEGDRIKILAGKDPEQYSWQKI